MTLEGIFGVPLDVTATYIVLFTIYGAVLEHSGAGRFFIDWAASTVGRMRSGSGAGTPSPSPATFWAPSPAAASPTR